MALATSQFLSHCVSKAVVGQTLELRVIDSAQSVDATSTTLSECLSKEATGYTKGTAIAALGAYDATDDRWELSPLEFTLTAGTGGLTFAQVFLILKDTADILIYASDASATVTLAPSQTYTDIIDLSLAGATE